MENQKPIKKSALSKLSPLVDEDQMLDQTEIDEEAVNVVRKEKILMRKIFQGFKKFWIWVIVAILVGIVGGTIYSKSVKPYYATTLRVMFAAEAKEEGGSPYSYNITQQLKATINDFIKTEVVLDRANYYYDQFGQRAHLYPTDKVGENGLAISQVDQFFEDCKSGVVPQFDRADWELNEKNINKQIFADRITVTSEKDSDLFVLYIKYSGYAEDDMASKVEILRYAAQEEAREVGEDSQNIYFGAYINLRDLGQEGTAVISSSDTKVITLGAIVGLVVAGFIIVLFCLLDSRVKDKDEIELITGTNLIAYIDLQGEE